MEADLKEVQSVSQSVSLSGWLVAGGCMAWDFVQGPVDVTGRGPWKASRRKALGQGYG